MSSLRRETCKGLSSIDAVVGNVAADKEAEGWGDAWTWVGIDADSRLCVSYLVGGRDSSWAHEFTVCCSTLVTAPALVVVDIYSVTAGYRCALIIQPSAAALDENPFDAAAYLRVYCTGF